MRAIGLIKTDDIESQCLKDIVENFITFFEEYEIDVKPYLAIREYEFGTEILSVNIDEIYKHMQKDYGNTQRKMGIYKHHSEEITKAIVELLCNKFLDSNESIEDEYSTRQYTVYDGRYMDYCTVAIGPCFDDEAEDDSISAQFLSGSFAVCAFQIEFITDYAAYCFKETIGMLALQNIWNMLENGKINEFQAAICMKPFYQAAEVKNSSKLMYGDGQELIEIMLDGMKARL